MSDEDEEALRQSISDSGMIQPLLVIPQIHDPTSLAPPASYWVVDGIHRLKSVPEGELIPCVVVELAEGATVRDLALECASVGRSRSAGQRILVRLERDKAQILAAAEMGAEIQKGYFGSAAQSRDRADETKDFSSMGIARELGVSQKDTLLAIELLRAHEERRGLSSVVGGLRKEGRKLKEGDPELAAIDDAWGRVLAGTLPIRRWKAAMAGAAATKGVGKAATDWLVVGNRAIASLRGVLCDHWAKLPLDDRLGLLERLRDIAADLPREVREIFAGGAK
jgi:hypothetical protein